MPANPSLLILNPGITFPLRHFSFCCRRTRTLTTLALLRTSSSSSSSSSSSYATAKSNENVRFGRTGSISIPPPSTVDVVKKIDVNPPKGTRDFPPDEMRLRNWLFHNFRQVSQMFAFEEVDFPVLESEALFIRKAGEEIRDQLYCFEDRGNRRVALRPELTPSLARLVIQKGKSVSLPLKWFAVGQCWRYERMTRGRRREHYQWNMDIIGVPDVTVLQEVLQCYSIPDNLFGKVCIIIDKIVDLVKSFLLLRIVRGFVAGDFWVVFCSFQEMEKIPIDEIKKELRSVELSDEAIEELLQVLSIKSLTKLEEKLGAAGEAVADLKRLFSLAEKFGYSEWIQFDASVVRGLAYYTGTVFEGFDREGKLRAICGGGRYDRLLSTFGGDDIPACGFGFGDAVIIELLKEKGLIPEMGEQVENIVCHLDPDLQDAAAAVATILRGKGQSVDLVLENKPLKWVFKRAARINARRLVLVGNSEWQKGMVSVKILSSGEQYEIEVDKLE
ncbi:histidine--tRNA ligase, chloroplastic/mitochondrial isoform X3 [Camellia sinensis]|uniref:histidine--tRNA ligase, chloroplastic/mitochondrial isoform X3 n=1 Tax=Camellia sinensis TaxID=4442 RepID=UPI001036AF5B|nr:histidine--tRNA ligase, chloroplastic/mitochondrial isoform X3 [Camellia sinensis]